MPCFFHSPKCHRISYALQGGRLFHSVCLYRQTLPPLRYQWLLVHSIRRFHSRKRTCSRDTKTVLADEHLKVTKVYFYETASKHHSMIIYLNTPKYFLNINVPMIGLFQFPSRSIRYFFI